MMAARIRIIKIRKILGIVSDDNDDENDDGDDYNNDDAENERIRVQIRKCGQRRGRVNFK